MDPYRDRPKGSAAKVEPNPLRERYDRLSSDELLTMVLRSPGDYSEKALDVARGLLTERGVDIERVKSERDAQAELAHAAADQEREAVETSVAHLTNAGRALGVCCACKERPPTTDLAMAVVRVRITGPVPTGGVATTDRLSTVIPLCAECAPKWRPRYGWTAGLFALAPAIALGGIVLLIDLLPPDLDRWLVKLVMTIPLFAALFVAFLPWAHRGRAVGRLSRLHPAYAALVADGFLLKLPHEQGPSEVARLTGMLSDSDARIRHAAEERLARCSGTEVVGLLRARLDHPIAARHAVRLLGVLRARDAIGDVRRVATSGPADAQEEARAVLAALE